MTPPPFNWRGRETLLRDLPETYDVLIIGGGIIGCATARETARRGYRVLVLEKGDLGCGTSSRSSRLIHGGLRYLKNGRVKVVWQAVRERQHLRRAYPHLVRPLHFVIPFYAGEGEGPLATRLGLWIYDLLAGFRNVQRHRNLRPEQVLALEPRLRAEGLRGGALYYDCATDDFRMVLLRALEAHGAGAHFLTYCPVDSLEREGERVTGVRFHDEFTGDSYRVGGQIVVNAAGPWSDVLRRGVAQARALLRPTKGAHFLTAHSRLPLAHAVVMRAPDDGRVVFALPWGGMTLLGTTDTDFAGDLDHVWADENDADYLLRCVNRAFPSAHLTPEDIVSGFASLRPLIAEYGVQESDVSRDFRLVRDAPGMISLVGGKLTTHRPAAQRIARWVERSLGSPREPPVRHDATLALSAETLGRLQEEVARRVRSFGLPQSTGDRLLVAYGRDVLALLEDPQGVDGVRALVPGLPYLRGEVDYAVDHELALRLGDVMIRRTHVFYDDPDHGMGVVEDVADRLAARMAWSPERRGAELQAYADLIAQAEAFRGRG